MPTVEERLHNYRNALDDAAVDDPAPKPGASESVSSRPGRGVWLVAATVVTVAGLGTLASLRDTEHRSADHPELSNNEESQAGAEAPPQQMDPEETASAPPADTTDGWAEERHVDPLIYDGLRLPSEAELVDGLQAFEERRTVALVNPDGVDPWWLTVWIVEIDGAVPIYCVGSPIGSGCSADSPVVEETPAVELLSVGGVPSELVVRARPDVRSIVADGVDGVGRVAVEPIGVPTQARIAGLRIPDPDAEITLTAFDSEGRELGQVAVVASQIDPRAMGEWPAVPGRPNSLPPHAPVELSGE